MPLQQLPTTGLDDTNHRRRHREITNSILTHQFDDSKVRTAAEIAAGVTPINYAYAPAGPEIDARRYGWSDSASAATNAAAITTAVSVLQNMTSGTPGGIIRLPAGEFDCDEIFIPKFIRVRGAGSYSTIIQYANNGIFATLGALTNSTATPPLINFACEISDLAVVLAHKDATGIYCRETRNAILSRMYLEGPATAGRTTRGIVFDGGNASSFANHALDVDCNHIENSFVILTTGSQRATFERFTNCMAFGDVDSVGTASKGLSIINSGGGDGTTWDGGNFEHCGTGVYCDATALCFMVDGARFEGNTTDIVLTAGCKPAFFFGLQTPTAYNVTDPNGVGGFYGCATVGGSRWSSQDQFTATLTTMSAATTGQIQWRRMDKIVELYASSSLLGTLNGTSLTLTGLPQALTPSVNKGVPCGFIENSGQHNAGIALVKSDNTIVFYINTVSGGFVRPSSSGFVTATSTGIQAGWAIRYGLD